MLVEWPIKSYLALSIQFSISCSTNESLVEESSRIFCQNRNNASNLSLCQNRLKQTHSMNFHHHNEWNVQFIKISHFYAHFRFRMDQDKSLNISYDEWRDFLLLAPSSDLHDILRFWRHSTVSAIKQFNNDVEFHYFTSK